MRRGTPSSTRVAASARALARRCCASTRLWRRADRASYTLSRWVAMSARNSSCSAKRPSMSSSCASRRVSASSHFSGVSDSSSAFSTAWPNSLNCAPNSARCSAAPRLRRRARASARRRLMSAYSSAMRSRMVVRCTASPPGRLPSCSLSRSRLAASVSSVVRCSANCPAVVAWGRAVATLVRAWRWPSKAFSSDRNCSARSPTRCCSAVSCAAIASMVARSA